MGQLWIENFSEGSPQGAGRQPETELHRPPPLPHGSRGCDHRHRVRAVLAQTGTFKAFASGFYFGVIFTSIDKNLESLVIVFIVMPEHDFVKKIFYFVFLVCRHPPSARREEPSRVVVRYLVV